jgi:GxxExxY protein
MNVVELNALTEHVIGLAIVVHRTLGPGMLESVYHRCLKIELLRAGLDVESKKKVPISYKGTVVDDALEVDLLVNALLVVEVKHVAALAPIHGAQTITYLRFTGCQVGLLINFNVVRLKDGLKRLVLGFPG